MVATRIELRDFRNYEHAELELGEGLTVVAGPNGAGKTNLLEGLYFGCTARSPRTSNERELVRRGAEVTRVVLDTVDAEGAHRIEVGFEPGEAKRLRVDGGPVDSLSTIAARPLASVFLPERLELIKGAPAGRRAHLDQVIAALWPARAATRAAYSRALAQRNALIARIRAGAAGPGALDAWDAELARQGIRLMEDRAEAVAGLREPFVDLAARLGLPGAAELRYRPRSAAEDADELTAELAERRSADLERGFTAHGPHRDELQLLLEGVPLRAYGSQGQQRVALLALLFAERMLLAERRARPPLMLLDDVMSELDAERRELLAELLRSGGQAVVTATEPEHVPGAGLAGGGLVRVDSGAIRSAAGVVAA
ncbi:MAG: DNA replication and repair protein RecF [Thermoleophilaceae bacterium]